MMQSIIYQKIIIMKLWISFIKGTKPFFFLKKERNILYWGPQALGLPPRPSIYKEQPLSCFFGLKRTTPFKLDKNGKCIKTQKANNRTSLQYAICKTKLYIYIYILCVHLKTVFVQEVSNVYSSTQNPRRSLTCCFKGVQHWWDQRELLHYYYYYYKFLTLASFS